MKRNLKLKFIWGVVWLMGLSFFSEAQITLTIEQALDIAEDNNPQMKSAKLNLERTRYSLEAQRAALKPQFSMNVSPISYSQTRSFDNRYSEWYTNKSLGSSGTFRTSLPILLTDGTLSLVDEFGWQDRTSMNQNGENRNKAFANDLSIRYTQPIFTYNRLKMQLQRLEFDHENSGISYALQRLTMESSITSQFYQVYMTQKELEISRDQYENAKKDYEIIKEKVEADLSAREELFQADVNLATAESSVESNIVRLENAKDGLKQTLGIPLNEEINVIADVAITPIMIDQEKAIHSGLTSRMELRQREIDIAESDLQMITVKAMNEFRGDISLSIGITGDNQRFEDIYKQPTQSPRVGITFTVPIFDWGEKRARIRAQETSQTVAKLNYENLKVNFELSIRQTIRRIGNLLTQISIREKNVLNAQQTYELNQIRYREGDLTGMQMSLIQVQLSNARISLEQALIDYKNELLNLKIITLYDFEKDKPIVPVRELPVNTQR